LSAGRSTLNPAAEQTFVSGKSEPKVAFRSADRILADKRNCRLSRDVGLGAAQAEPAYSTEAVPADLGCHCFCSGEGC
jgi:hypothetical protein